MKFSIKKNIILEHFIEKECLNKYKEETSLESIYGEKSINVPFVYKLTSNEFKSIKEVLEIYMRENKGAYNSLFEELKKEIDLSIKCVGDDENVFIDFFNTYHDLTPGNLCVTEKQLSIPKGRISQIKMQNFNEKGFNALENIVKSASASYVNKLKDKIYSFISEKLTPVKKDCFLEDAHTVLSYAESITKTSQLMDERVKELSTEVKKDIPNLEKDDELLPF